MKSEFQVCQQDAASRSGQQQVAALFEQAAAGMAQTDLTGRFIWANDSYCAILGRSREELLQLRIRDVTYPEDLPHNAMLFDRLVETGEPFHIEKRYVRPDGSVVWGSNAVEIIRDSSGEFEATLGVCIDISGRKNAEAALRESEVLKSAILEAALDCIITIDRDSYVVEWNPAAERTFGYARAEALGQDLAQLIVPPELRERHHRGMAEYLASGRGPVLGQRMEVEALRRDGSRIPVELAITPIHLEGKQFFTAYLRDISARKEADARLRQSEARLQATFENAFAGISEVDPNGRFLRVNEELCRITGYSRDELLNRGFQDVTPPEDLKRDLEQFERQMAADGVDAYQLEKRFIHRNGSVVWVDLSASRVDDELGRPMYGVRVVRDITDRKRAQEHQRLLVDELNHRVKNTLATVQSISSQTLRNSSTMQEAKDAIENRLMALSRAHNVLTQEKWETARLHDILAKALEPHSRSEEHRLRLEGPETRLQPRIALALAMAVQELATNAVKFGALSNESGEVQVRWTVDHAASPHRLDLRWEETGGPPVTVPHRRGFGSRLVERNLAQELDGAVRIDFIPTGVVCTIDVPLA